MSAKVSVLLSLVHASSCGGQRTIEVEAGTVLEALQNLAGKYPALARSLLDDRGRPVGWINLYLNQQDVRLLDGEHTRLTDGDELIVLSALSGG